MGAGAPNPLAVPVLTGQIQPIAEGKRTIFTKETRNLNQRQLLWLSCRLPVSQHT